MLTWFSQPKSLTLDGYRDISTRNHFIFRWHHVLHSFPPKISTLCPCNGYQHFFQDINLINISMPFPYPVFATPYTWYKVTSWYPEATSVWQISLTVVEILIFLISLHPPDILCSGSDQDKYSCSNVGDITQWFLYVIQSRFSSCNPECNFQQWVSSTFSPWYPLPYYLHNALLIPYILST